jgi:hypothetical protein
MRKNFYEIFEEIEKAKDTGTRVEILRKNASPALLQYFRNVYNPRIRFCVETIPQYKSEDVPVGMSFTSIDMELRRDYLFQEGHPKRPANLPKKRLDEILIQMLEALEAKDAKILAEMFHKKVPYPSITRALVESAFPNQI